MSLTTTQADMDQLQAKLIEQHRAALDRFPNLNQQTRQDLEAGFKEGVRAGMEHFAAMLGVEVKK